MTSIATDVAALFVQDSKQLVLRRVYNALTDYMQESTSLPFLPPAVHLPTPVIKTLLDNE